MILDEMFVASLVAATYVGLVGGLALVELALRLWWWWCSRSERANADG